MDTKFKLSAKELFILSLLKSASLQYGLTYDSIYCCCKEKNIYDHITNTLNVLIKQNLIFVGFDGNYRLSLRQEL